MFGVPGMDKYELLSNASIALLIVALLLRFLRSTLSPPTDTDTLDEYLRRHPDCRRNGRIHCYRCDSTSIYLYRLGYGPGWIQHLHVCRQCGAKLYRSKIEL